MLTVVPFPIKFKNSDTLKGEIMDPSYTQDLRNRPEKHPETPTDAVIIKKLFQPDQIFRKNCILLAMQHCAH